MATIGRRRKRRKAASKKAVVGKNCRWLDYEDGQAVCGFVRCSGGGTAPCRKRRGCGYEEESSTVGMLMEKISKEA